MKRSNTSFSVLLSALKAGWGIVLLVSVFVSCQEEAQEAFPAYRGIWYSNQPDSSEYRYKYSGGLATYPQQHIPIAIYSEEAQKTFFVYGGVHADTNLLAYQIGYFDHQKQQVSRPVTIATKNTDDAHDNPVLSMDDDGYLWVFANAHGIARPAFIFKSDDAYNIQSFTQVDSTNFSYSQPWYVEDKGFVWLHTLYHLRDSISRRGLFSSTSPNGIDWSTPEPFAFIGEGNYQISWKDGGKVATVFDHHPETFWGQEQRERYRGLNHRSNIYYAVTEDAGKTWQNAQGDTLTLPINEVNNPALALNTFKDKQLAYLKDIAFDALGNPVILYMRSKGYEPGPENGPRTWHTLRWNGEEWLESAPITISDNNYDHGSLYVEGDGTWRIIAPTATGPQAYNPGGEMVMWTSNDEGKTWQSKPLTTGSPYNHTYARKPVNAHPDFYAIWADGHARQPSESRLYFCNRAGDVFRLPTEMSTNFAMPETFKP